MNNKIKIYCEDGGLTKRIKQLAKSFNVYLVSFPFENINKKTKDCSKPSNLTIDSTYITADNTDICIGDTHLSNKFYEIQNIIGKNNFNDVRHFDTAYKEGCKIFITPDKKDISSKSERLFDATGVMTFHCDDIDRIKDFCNKISE